MNELRRNLLLLTHAYHWLLPGFAHFWAKYLGEPLTVVSDRDPGGLPAGLDYMRVPCYSEGEWPWQHWFSDGLAGTLKAVPEPVVSLWLPDAWLVGPVDAGDLHNLTEYVTWYPNLVRLNLGEVVGVRGAAEFRETFCGFEMFDPGKNNRALGYYGGLRFGVGLWNRERLLTVFESGWSLWGFEHAGSWQMWSRFPQYVSLIPLPCPVRTANVMSRGRLAVDPKEFAAEDREVVKRWTM